MPERLRIQNRLAPAMYSGSRSYLVTICTQERKKLFTTPDIVNPLVSLLGEQAQIHLFSVHAYCFMPDHCHFLVSGLSPPAQLSKLIRAFKGKSAVLLRRLGLRHVWQKGFHDHVIRDSQELRSASAYVFENPLRAGLVKNIYDWPFSGSLLFAWREFKIPSEKFTPSWKSL